MLRKVIGGSLGLILFCTGLSFGALGGTLKAKFVNDMNASEAGVRVMVVAFTGSVEEPNSFYSRVGETDSFGIIEFTGLDITDSLSNPIKYKIGFIKERTLPNIKEQIYNPEIPSYQFADDGDIIDLTGTPIYLLKVPDTQMFGKLEILISSNSVADNTLMDIEIVHGITGQLAAQGLDMFVNDGTTAAYPAVEVVNVPPAIAGTYKLRVRKVGNYAEGAEVVISTAIINNQVSEQGVVIGYVSTMPQVDISKIAFEGLVTNNILGNPISNCSVEISQTVQTSLTWQSLKTVTDASGKFVFYSDSVVFSSYSVLISKIGYKSKYDNPNAIGPNPGGYYYSGTRIILPKYELEIATGIIQGKVTLNGAGLPDTEVGLQTEWSRWNGPYSESNQGGGYFRTLTNGDGSFIFDGIAPGNYDLRVFNTVLKKASKYWHGESIVPDPSQPWNYNYMFSYGDNQKSSYTCLTTDGFPDWGDPLNYRLDDDVRIVVTSDTIKSEVYDALGVMKSSGAINIGLEVALSTTARVTGAIYFPDNKTPVKETLKIVAHPIDPQTRRWTEWEGNDIAYYADQAEIIASPGSAQFSINVSTGTYFVEIRSDEWSPAQMYNTEALLKEPGVVWRLQDVKMVKSGRLEGKIRLPDGSYFQAKNTVTGNVSAFIEARGVDVQYERREELREWSIDPTRFIFPSLSPGKYNLWIEIRQETAEMNKGEDLYPQTLVSNIMVAPGQTTFVEASIKNGILCEPIAPIPPETTEVDYSERSATGRSMYGIIGFPTEISLNGFMLHSVMNNEGKLDDVYLPFIEYNGSEKSWGKSCIIPGKYNFYMIYVRTFGPSENTSEDDPGNNPDEYLTIISRAENVSVKSDNLAEGATFQIRMGAGTMGAGILTGRVTGKNFFLPQDGEKFKGKQNEFNKYTPTIMLYDMEGALRAYSSITSSNAVSELSKWMGAMETGDVTAINQMINSDEAGISSPVSYYIDNIPLGKYILVGEAKNYPPITKIITVSTGTTALNLNFDVDASAGSKIFGTITDENGNPLSEANIRLVNRMGNKRTSTDADGKFLVLGLSYGSYRIDVTKPGYAVGGQKVSLGKTDMDITIKLKTAGASIAGTVYVKEGEYSSKSIYSGAKIVAYNESENVANPGEYLPSIAGKTENDGTYKIPDMVLNNTYYVYTFVPERPAYYKRVFVSAPVMTNINFEIQPSTPSLKIAMKRTANPLLFKFFIESPRPLVSAPVCYYSPGTEFSSLNKIRALPTPGAINSYALDVELPGNSDEEYYTLSITGQYGINDFMTEEINFSRKFLAKAQKNVSEELAEGGSILIDDERADNTEVKLDPGTLISEEMAEMPVGGFLTALPSFKMSKTGRDISSLIDSAMSDIAASEVYEIALNNAQVNKSFDVTLNYDRKKVDETDIDKLQVYRYNDTTQKWDVMPGVTSVDPLTGTVSVEVDRLSSSAGLSPAPKSKVKNGVFTINRAASTSQKGAYAVFKQDPNTAKNYSGSNFSIYNFPNPFDLKMKNVALSDVNSASAQSISGTMIKYSLPSASSGRLEFYIYNLAGELVKEMDEGVKSGGYYYYSEWDGKNDSSEECSSGVYFLIAKLDGKKMNDKPLKIVILK